MSGMSPPPASRASTVTSGFSDKRLAMTEPPAPVPTTMKSYSAISVLELLVGHGLERDRVVDGPHVGDLAVLHLEVVAPDGADGDAGGVGRLVLPDHRGVLALDDDVLGVHQE